MASKWLEDAAGVPEVYAGGGNPWQDPQFVDHFSMKQREGPLRVIQLSPEATAGMWNIWRKSSKVDRYTVLLSFAGEVLDSKLTQDPAWWPAQRAIESMCAVYNMHRRRCWRPVWSLTTPLDIRGLGNMSYESVRILGSDKLIPGWESRPRVRLFDNP